MVARAVMVALAKVGVMGKPTTLAAVALNACKPPCRVACAVGIPWRGRPVEMRAVAAVAGGGQMAVMPQTYRSLRQWGLVSASALGG